MILKKQQKVLFHFQLVQLAVHYILQEGCNDGNNLVKPYL